MLSTAIYISNPSISTAHKPILSNPIKMASTKESLPTTSSLSHLPSPTHQTSYLLTGALAGAASLPAELTWLTLFQRPHFTTPLNFLKTTAPWAISRGGIRFWTFDLVRSQLHQSTNNLPVWIKGGLGGAAGGLNEVLFHSLVSQRTLPHWKVAGAQTLKLFFCFGTYTFLSTGLSPERLPPKPFPLCWAMGVTAGAVGSGVVAALEGVGGRRLWAAAVPRGAVTIGTVIAVQVTSCDMLLRALDCKG